MDHIHEPARQTSVDAVADVVVCGGGPAGIGAALSAARSGAKTIIVECHGCLGGIWTAGALSWILDYGNKPGVMSEIMAAITAMGGRAVRNGKPTNGCDVEKMKLLLEQLCLTAGIDIRLHTRVVDTHRDGRRLTHVVTESKSGRQALAASCFVDCTGDGDLGKLAGCGFDIGHPETGLMQPMSFVALVAGIDPQAVAEFHRSSEEMPWAAPKDALRAAMEQGGHSPSYQKPTLLWIRDGLFMLMANHEYGVNGTNAKDVTAATLRARQELHNLVDGLRSTGGVWTNLHLVATGAQIGVREGRRLHGHYTVSEEDLRIGRRHDDAVCEVTFPVDVHATDPKKGKSIEPRRFKSLPYDIPLRALMARDVDGLLMAGRCISGDFIAHSSYRVTGNAVAMGEAAGRLAAAAAITRRLPQDIDAAGIVVPG